MSKISVEKYIEGVESIYTEKPTYKVGHDGSDGECDCIGMCRGGLKRGGATGVKNMGGTNTAARKAIGGLTEISSTAQLQLGDVVLKVRDPDDPDMPLPDKFRKGGTDYDPVWGETNFTHIGTVTGVAPLEITHMTSPTAKKDTKIGSWKYFGILPWVDSDVPAPEPQPEPVEPSNKATVFFHSGSTVNMRKYPNIGAALVERVPIGEEVEVIQYGADWTKIKWRYWTGYMQTRFLVFDGDVPPIYYTVTIPGLSKEQAEAIVAEHPSGVITVG